MSEARKNVIDETALRVLIENVFEIYESKRPRPSHVTIKQASEMLGVSYPTIKKLVNEKKIRTNLLGTIPITEIDKLLVLDKSENEKEQKKKVFYTIN